jgi:parallel beta-helix repeat protein
VVFKDGAKKEHRITLRSYPGETATFRGSIYIPKGSDYVTVLNMRLDGSYGPVGKGHFKGDRNTKQAVKVMADDVFVLNNDITNRRANGNPDLAGTCIIVGSSKITAANTSIKANRIHRCGQMPSINREHGIYASHPRGAKISDNLIYDNAARGIQLYPSAQWTLVDGNVINHNGQGIVFGGSSSNNTVRGNVISNPVVSYNVSASPRGARGSANLVERNCLWTRSGTSGINPNPSVFTARNNVVAKPGSSRCRSVL